MKKRWSLLLSIAAVAAASTTVFAGSRRSDPVEVYDIPEAGYSWARGSMAAARNSDDDVQGIGCELYGNSDYGVASCWARTATGKYLTCYTRVSEEMKLAVASITPSSYIEFQTIVGDPSHCGLILVRSSSEYELPR